MEIPSTFARHSSSYSLLGITYLMGECSNFVTILADDYCARNDSVALYIIEMSGKANNDWCESNRIDDCQKCHECADGESYHEKRPPKYCLYYITLKVNACSN